jgi:hypothetical protein
MTSKEKGRRLFNNRQWQETAYFRPTALSYEETQDIKSWYTKGQNISQIALTYGVTIAAVRKALGHPDLR